MTYEQALDFFEGYLKTMDAAWVECSEDHIEAYNIAIEAIKSQMQTYKIVSTSIYDVEERHENCTVQILKNSVTGEISVGWWENKESE